MAGIQCPEVVVLVLNWNGKEDTLACLSSLGGVRYPNFRTVVVDNASKDGSTEAFLREFPDIRVIQTGSNLGYAGGNNFGLRNILSEGDRPAYILLLNNDTTVDPDFLSELVGAADNRPDGCFFSPLICFHGEPSKVWYGGGKWDSARWRTTHVDYCKTRVESDRGVARTEYASGCALLVRVAALDQLGLMEEKFFLTFEETDWCFRAHRLGWYSYVVKSSLVLHKISVSFGGSESPLANYYMTRNRLLWVQRHLGTFAAGQLLARLAFDLFPQFPDVGAATWASPRRFYWAIREYLQACRTALRSDAGRAKLYGARDFIARRFGQQAGTIDRIYRRSPA